MSVFIESSNIISPLGFSTKENYNNILEGKSGINNCTDRHLSPKPFPVSRLNRNLISEKFDHSCNNSANYTFFEQLSILSIYNALRQSNGLSAKKRTLLILSTTKGNNELLENMDNESFSEEPLYLNTSAKKISQYFKIPNEPLVVSSACISGVLAMVVAQRLIKAGIYDNVIVNGTDILSRFVVSGFQSFLSLSANPCKPFDKNRDGLTLGEASATVVLTKEKSGIEILNGASSNDANHISGPSRTGEGLFLAIKKTLKMHDEISLISAHGTATPYNDDMESIALKRAGLSTVPTNSLKGYYGHTLGAAGVIETIINLESLKNNCLIKTLGCSQTGTVENINVIKENKEQKLTTLLKLASGFGGCNAAALFLKHE